MDLEFQACVLYKTAYLPTLLQDATHEFGIKPKVYSWIGSINGDGCYALIHCIDTSAWLNSDLCFWDCLIRQ